MALRQYKQKREFSETPEPKGEVKSSSTSRTPTRQKIFVVQKHDASHLHYDFRLEMSGVLKSWAIPKEPPMEKGVKRLAIQVEDHPLAYKDFEGTIPNGYYGAGKVEIWDKGTYELVKKTEKEIEIKLNGKKLKGKYVLVKTRYGSKPEKSWLLFKVG